ncbi:MAG: hypothetical protein AAF497_08780 [Planctomycetota bacterium]
MRRLIALILVLIGVTPSCYGQDLPWYVDSVTVTSAGTNGIAAVRLDGVWPDTCVPDTISHRVAGNHVQLSVTAPILNVGCGDLPSPWSLTEEFTANDAQNFSIFGSLIAVDPNDRNIRDHLSGPDLLYRTASPTANFHGLGNSNPDYVTRAHDVSADGRVVTGAIDLGPNSAGFIVSEAFRWTQREGVNPLGLLPGGVPGGSRGLGISADGGTIVGQSTSDLPFSNNEAFRWQSNTGMVGLGNLIETSSTVANASSHGGRVVVGSNEFAAPGPFGLLRSAFRWTSADGMQDLGGLVPGGETYGNDVTRNGQLIAGTSASAPNPNDPFVVPGLSLEPFVWTESDGMLGLGHLPYDLTDVPHAYNTTTGAAISGHGAAVVGTSRMVSLDGPFDLRHRAFRWTEADGMIDLGDLPLVNPLLVKYDAVDVSDRGRTVIGNVTFGGTATDTFPFIWNEEDGMQLLSTVLSEQFGLPYDLDGWDLGTVAAISDDGLTIVGTGTNPDGDQEAWRVVMEGKVFTNGRFFGTGIDISGQDFSAPVPEPSGFVLMLMAVVSAVRITRKNSN